MRNGVDTIRHLEVFNDEEFNYKVDVIGCGAVGSKLVLELVKLGIKDIRVWDDDSVEEHNIANQVFGNQHIGMSKVDALKQVVHDFTGVEIETRQERVVGGERLRDVVFCVPDSMQARKDIWEGCIRLKPWVKAYFEARMGADSGLVFYADPLNPGQHNKYEQNFYTDDEAAKSVCGAPISVGPTASITASYLAWSLIHWFQNEQSNFVGLEPVANEVTFGVGPPMVFTSKY